MKQIIAIGGGGFGNEKSNLKFEKYLISLTKTKTPHVCFLPQASNEAKEYIVKFFETFTQLGAIPSWVSLFGRVKEHWEAHLLNQDIIYVGGGNTKSMIALWKAWGVDKILKKAYEKGVILAGVSAGAICWFEQGITDSVWPLGIVDALGFIHGSVCPHFDSEIERQETYRHHIKTNTIKPGFALEDETALHFINAQLHAAIKTTEHKKIINMDLTETVVKTTLI